LAGRVTLQTLADAVGVSRTTVSNAYNRPDQLAPELRAAILEKAAELGYAGPDPAARRLRSGRRRAVALMFSERLSYAVTDPAAIALLQGLAEATEAKGYELLLLPGQRGTGVEVESVREAVVGAFCLYCMPDDHPALRAALERRLPVVVVDEPRLLGTFFVGIDDHGGARQAAEHVRALGHEHVAVIVDRLRDDGAGDRVVDAARIAEGYYRVSRERIAGYFEGLGKLVPVYEALENQRAAGERAAAALLALSPRPTALLCASDQLALGALDAIRAAGLDVPGDVAVAGYDDVPEAAGAGLTTVRQPLLEKGRQAGRLLLERDTEREVVLPVELVVRGSTVPPALTAYGTLSGPLSV
jgi:DNA-binding LacI/PurR family transcriptional regulator